MSSVPTAQPGTVASMDAMSGRAVQPRSRRGDACVARATAALRARPATARLCTLWVFIAGLVLWVTAWAAAAQGTAPDSRSPRQAGVERLAAQPQAQNVLLVGQIGGPTVGLTKV